MHSEDRDSRRRLLLRKLTPEAGGDLSTTQEHGILRVFLLSRILSHLCEKNHLGNIVSISAGFIIGNLYAVVTFV